MKASQPDAEAEFLPRIKLCWRRLASSVIPEYYPRRCVSYSELSCAAEQSLRSPLATTISHLSPQRRSEAARANAPQCSKLWERVEMPSAARQTAFLFRNRPQPILKENRAHLNLLPPLCERPLRVGALEPFR